MKVTVDETLCSGCGVCEEMAPDVFEMNDAGVVAVKVNPIPGGLAAVHSGSRRRLPVRRDPRRSLTNNRPARLPSRRRTRTALDQPRNGSPGVYPAGRFS